MNINHHTWMGFELRSSGLQTTAFPADLSSQHHFSSHCLRSVVWMDSHTNFEFVLFLSAQSFRVIQAVVCTNRSLLIFFFSDRARFYNQVGIWIVSWLAVINKDEPNVFVQIFKWTSFSISWDMCHSGMLGGIRSTCLIFQEMQKYFPWC